MEKLQHTDGDTKRASTAHNRGLEVTGLESAFYSLYGLGETDKSFQRSVSLFIKVKGRALTLFGFWK